MDLQQSPEQTEQQTLFSLEELTITKSKSVTDLKNQLKTAREMIRDGYNSSELYKEQDNRVKGEKLQLKDIKLEIDKIPSQAALLSKAKVIASELKEKQQEISDYALEVSRISGANQIDRDGETYEIVKSAVLVRRTQ